LTTVETGGITGTFLSDAIDGPVVFGGGVEVDCFRVEIPSSFSCNNRSFWNDIIGLENEKVFKYLVVYTLTWQKLNEDHGVV
jgi:hypothetical protein